MFNHYDIEKIDNVIYNDVVNYITSMPTRSCIQFSDLFEVIKDGIPFYFYQNIFDTINIVVSWAFNQKIISVEGYLIRKL
jgi:hypothetical protein